MSEVNLRRGFKSWAEQQAITFRETLDIHPCAPLAAARLAQHLDVPIINPSHVPDMPIHHMKQLLEIDQWSWSGVTIVYEDAMLIIKNSSHPLGRQESDVMHELSHVICKHAAARVVQHPSLPLAQREYDVAQEKEAAWLGSCLQLPRSALSWAVKRRMSHANIAEHFGATEDMVSYRRRMTGVDKIRL